MMGCCDLWHEHLGSANDLPKRRYGEQIRHGAVSTVCHFSECLCIDRADLSELKVLEGKR